MSSFGQFTKIRLAQFSASFLESWQVRNNSSLIITVPGSCGSLAVDLYIMITCGGGGGRGVGGLGGGRWGRGGGGGGKGGGRARV